MIQCNKTTKTKNEVGLEINGLRLKISYWFKLREPVKKGVHISEIKEASTETKNSKAKNTEDEWLDF